MAPDIALQYLREMPENARILDPMCGSGTVLVEAAKRGICATGMDSDPLAVAISTVRSTVADLSRIRKIRKTLEQRISRWRGGKVSLPWIDGDEETIRFIDYWFSEDQIAPLRLIAREIAELTSQKIRNAEICFFKIALSRLIITKKRGASLAWDVSHSRPHKVKVENDFCVIDEFIKSMDFLERRLENSKLQIGSRVRLGDARAPYYSRNGIQYHAIITSPPYLNAIDYMRGHKLSLVWLGYTIKELRSIRSENVGSEKRPNIRHLAKDISRISEYMVGDTKYDNAIARYGRDAWKLLRSFHRALRQQGRLIMVVGDSRIRGKIVSNSTIIQSIAEECSGFRFIHKETRNIPDNRRYLPVGKTAGENLNKRMRQEYILEFMKTC